MTVSILYKKTHHTTNLIKSSCIFVNIIKVINEMNWWDVMVISQHVSSWWSVPSFWRSSADWVHSSTQDSSLSALCTAGRAASPCTETGRTSQLAAELAGLLALSLEDRRQLELEPLVLLGPPLCPPRAGRSSGIYMCWSLVDGAARWRRRVPTLWSPAALPQQGAPPPENRSPFVFSRRTGLEEETCLRPDTAESSSPPGGLWMLLGTRSPRASLPAHLLRTVYFQSQRYPPQWNRVIQKPSPRCFSNPVVLKRLKV